MWLKATLYRGTGVRWAGITSRAVLITEFWVMAKVQLSLKPLLSSALFPTGPFSFRRHSPQIYTFALRLLFLGLWVVWFFPKVPKAVVTDRRPSGPESSTQERLLCSSVVEEISQLYRSRAPLSFHGPLYSWLLSGFKIFNKVVGLLLCLSLALLD